MNRKVKLLDEQICVLESLPEQGMGYQIVDIEMLNGRVLIERIVIDSQFLKLESDEDVDPSCIKKIKLHQY